MSLAGNGTKTKYQQQVETKHPGIRLNSPWSRNNKYDIDTHHWSNTRELKQKNMNSQNKMNELTKNKLTQFQNDYDHTAEIIWRFTSSKTQNI